MRKKRGGSCFLSLSLYYSYTAVSDYKINALLSVTDVLSLSPLHKITFISIPTSYSLPALHDFQINMIN